MQQKIIFGFIVLTMLTLEGCSSVSKPTTTDLLTGSEVIATGAELPVSGTNVTTGTDTLPTISGKNISTTGVSQTGSVSATASGSVKVASKSTTLNGTYHIVKDYIAPSGKESIDAAVTIKNNIIIAVNVKNVAVNDKSKKYQDEFIKGISGQIVGKNIKDVKVSYISGASLTAKAFDEALHALK